jgi:hypothetical protein
MRHGLTVAGRFKAVVLVLAALFALAGAEPARGLPLAGAFGFWALSVGAGLGLAVLAAAGLARWPAMRRRPRWQAVGLAGVIGLLLYAPLSLGLEGAFGAVGPPEPADDGLDRLETAGGVFSLLAEVAQAGPLYLITWALLNVAPAALGAAPVARGGSSVPAGGGPEAAGTLTTSGAGGAPAAEAGALADRFAVEVAGQDASEDAAAAVAAAAPPPDPRPAAPDAPAATPTPPASAAEVLGWPPALGDEVLSVRADLHYLHVSTTLGRATVLGTLAAVEAHFGDAGLRIHRSHWVARRAIRRVAAGANGWRCELHDGQRLPISRRRVAEVRALLGRDFVLDAG